MSDGRSRCVRKVWGRCVSIRFKIKPHCVVQACTIGVIRAGISMPLQKQLDAYIRINEALTLYLSQLEKIDFEQFKKETEQYNQLLAMLEKTNNEDELNTLLRNEYEVLGIELPYSGDFDDFMNDASSMLEFK